jgi:hypothetical protein
MTDDPGRPIHRLLSALPTSPTTSPHRPQPAAATGCDGSPIPQPDSSRSHYEKTATIDLAGLHIAGIFLWSAC